MEVPPDDDDDLQLDFSAKNHAFLLDNVSCITHTEQNANGGSCGQTNPAHSDATTASIATLRRNNRSMNLKNMAHNNINNNNNNGNNSGMNNRQNTFHRTLEMNAHNNASPLAAAANGRHH